MSLFVRLLADESGTALVEYALVSATFALMAIGAFVLIENQSGARLGGTAANLTALGTTPR